MVPLFPCLGHIASYRVEGLPIMHYHALSQIPSSMRCIYRLEPTLMTSVRSSLELTDPLGQGSYGTDCSNDTIGKTNLGSTNIGSSSDEQPPSVILFWAPNDPVYHGMAAGSTERDDHMVFLHLTVGRLDRRSELWVTHHE